MGKWLLIIFLVFIKCTCSLGQLVLCQTVDKNIFIINHAEKTNKKIVTAEGEMVGYRVQDDTLIIFIREINGSINKVKYIDEKINDVSENQTNGLLFMNGYIDFSSGKNQVELLKGSSDTSNLWRVNYYKITENRDLAVDRCNNLYLFENGSLIKSYRGNNGFMGLGCIGFNDIKKTIQLSNDNKVLFLIEKDALLFPKKYVLMEADAKNGEYTKIYSHKAISYVSYSPDYKYVYFSIDEGDISKTFIYDRNSKKSSRLLIEYEKTSLLVSNLFCLKPKPS